MPSEKKKRGGSAGGFAWGERVEPPFNRKKIGEGGRGTSGGRGESKGKGGAHHGSRTGLRIEGGCSNYLRGQGSRKKGSGKDSRAKNLPDCQKKTRGDVGFP